MLMTWMACGLIILRSKMKIFSAGLKQQREIRSRSDHFPNREKVSARASAR
jgi:hypothetical protein